MLWEATGSVVALLKWPGAVLDPRLEAPKVSSHYKLDWAVFRGIWPADAEMVLTFFVALVGPYW